MAYYDPHFYRKTVALQVSLLILSTISVALRYLARRKRKAQLKGDDLWAFLSMLLYWLYIGFAFYGESILIATVRRSDLALNRFAQWRRPPTRAPTTICNWTCAQGKDSSPGHFLHDDNLTESVGLVLRRSGRAVHLHRGESQCAFAVSEALSCRQVVSYCKYHHASCLYHVVLSIYAVVRLPMHTGR